MKYQSIDKMQNAMSKEVFSHVESPKKAAGRALGTIVEIISFYLIKAWGHEFKIAIEKPLPEYANQEIKHNVEFTFHRSKLIRTLEAPKKESITSTRIFSNAKLSGNFQKPSSRNLLKDGTIRNACTVAFSDLAFCNAYFSKDMENIFLYELSNEPFAMFECKRVGVEDGCKKGPQTIEKAKQGSYVARTVSSIQRIRLSDGRMAGAVEHRGKLKTYDDYNTLIEHAIFEYNEEILKHFILTVGIVSNHGNWFTSNNQNKEIKVLAQSYDWLLFLTDNGLATFIQDILLDDNPKFYQIRDAFQQSYTQGRKSNRFTKTNMDTQADRLLTKYFAENLDKIQKWFNVISPNKGDINKLKVMLNKLSELEG
ncbi:MAG: hypothetical protein FWH04_02820 [Oscillospiraceae bacterium]|nr:hypothetical protein [Oscillospiraceae bacterium]